MATKLTLTQDDRDFLIDRSYDRKTIAVGYLRGLDRKTHDKYAALMKQIEPEFSPTPWCDDCVYKMAKKVWEYFHTLLEPEKEIAIPDPAPSDPSAPQDKPRRTRNKDKKKEE